VRRFYKHASHRAVDGGFEILLDARPVKTPARSELVVPVERLAASIAAEWNAQGDELDPRSMPFTGLANAAIDHVIPDRLAFARGLWSYGESDLLCYRAEAPAPLVERQARHWDKLLAWARRRFDIDFEVVPGIMHRAQPQATVARLADAVESLDAFRLAALSPLVTISGSLVIALALAEGAVPLDEAWEAASLDETWQTEQWGEDAEAAARFANRRRDFDAACAFLNLL
jgi:chaperone required for assembly of F1-ATPase